MIQLEIEGIPVSWKSHAGFGRRSFNPRFREKDYVTYHIKKQYSLPPIQGPVFITYDFYFPIPRSTSKVKRSKMLKDELSHIKRPDASNCIKFYEDCLKTIVIEDDSQVVEMIAKKHYSDHPRTYIIISKIEGSWIPLPVSTIAKSLIT